jgi:glutamate formiminotransferase
MSGNPAIIECVPNVSEGRDRHVLDRLAAGMDGVPGLRLVNVHVDPDHHRSVFSFLGDPTAVEAGALRLAAGVLTALDMRRHQGIHPRIGALDVVPFVPLAGMTMDDAVVVARRVGVAIGERHGVPVYFYGHAATTPARRRIADVRRGGYEALRGRLLTPEGAPDAGPARFDPRSGAVLVGARDILVAYNVWLDTDSLPAARRIAAAVRESSGGLPAVQALGIPLETRGLVQVSMNLVDYRVTPIPVAFDAVAIEAARRSIRVRGAELVGLAPRAAFAGRSPESVGLPDFTDSLYLDSYL